MTSRIVRALAFGLFAVAVVCVARSTLSAAVRPPKLQYQMTTLPNGLTVVLEEDHSTPIVHLQLWYHVGSKNEKPGRTGFAHLFEHLMFKGSKNVEPEAHTSMISSVGGQSNAYTDDDETVFWETVPSQYLPLIAVARGRSHGDAAHRQGHLHQRARGGEGRAPDAHRQPAVRPAERKSSTTRPSRCIPYKHPTIGSMTDLEAASIDDVRDFYHTYYVPANATLALVGDFDTAQAQQLVTQYLGRVPKAEQPVPRDIPKEPPQTKEKRVTLQEPWPLPAVVVAYHITNDGNPDSYPLHIAAKVLSDGESSRIYKKLVYEKQIAVAAFGQANLIEDPNLFYAVAIVQPPHTTQEAADALIAEIERLKSRADHRARAAAREEPVRARLHPRARIEPGEGAHARARRRHSPRHQDGRRRVRHLPEHHGRRRAARRAHLLHAGEPARAHADAVGRRPERRAAPGGKR